MCSAAPSCHRRTNSLQLAAELRRRRRPRRLWWSGSLRATRRQCWWRPEIMSSLHILTKTSRRCNPGKHDHTHLYDVVCQISIVVKVKLFLDHWIFFITKTEKIIIHNRSDRTVDNSRFITDEMILTPRISSSRIYHSGCPDFMFYGFSFLISCQTIRS